MGHASVDETFSRYGHLMPGTRDQARELVDDYMEQKHQKGDQSKQSSGTPGPPNIC
jgi:hypothetical protein